MAEEQTRELPRPTEEPKLSPAELKKRAKAEKQARRAAQKDEAAGGPPATLGGANQTESDGQQNRVSGNIEAGQRAKTEKNGQQQQPQKGQQKEGSLPTRNRRASQSGGAPQQAVKKQENKQAAKKQENKQADKRQENKQVELFSHLYTQPRRQTLDGVSKDVHPAVLALGLQIGSYAICGSSARCVAMLLAFKKAIHEYSTPTGTSLARHMTSHYLSPQIDFLKSCRPISESMGNAIRWLKKLIVEVDPNTPEQQAKDYLCGNIDKFIQERITIADQVIADSATTQIKHGSVVLTYARSSIVEKTILQAHGQGTRFRVIVLDSRPLFEGRNLATSLMRAGLEIEYLPFSGIARAVSDATVVLLGAHSMLSNGRLQSRVGTASIAMASHRKGHPVIVLCESVKFSGKVALDSIVLNEVAPPEELLPPLPRHHHHHHLAPSSSSSSSSSSFTSPTIISTGKGTSTLEEDEEQQQQQQMVGFKSLRDWKDIPNLQILNLMYDITPADYISIVVTEYGSLPPSSIPVVHALANGGL